MFNIGKLLGKSPFAPLKAHLEKVLSCLSLLKELLALLAQDEREKLLQVAEALSLKEHEADLMKNDLRAHLPKTLFLPISRADFLTLLSLQDHFANVAEDIAVTLTLKPLKHYGELKGEFEKFFQENFSTFELACRIIGEFHLLIEATFGGVEAEKVKEMIQLLSLKEYELDKLQYLLIKKLYSLENKFAYTDFFLWQSLIRQVGQLSNTAEKIGNVMLLLLELK